MAPGQRVFLDVNPATRRLPPSRIHGADHEKLTRQIARYGKSTHGMPIIEVTRGKDGELQINNGVTRATRIAKLLPGQRVRVEVIDERPKWDFSRRPTIGETIT
jgi:CRISPR/Cas system-associated protein Cas5 (RAMP superfamily)